MTTTRTEAQRVWSRAIRESLEMLLAEQLRAAGITGYVREYEFLPGSRKYRADFAFTDARLLVEIDGAEWVSGTGHNSGTGKTRDCERDAEALIAGWRVMRVTGDMVRSTRAVVLIERFLARGQRDEP